MNSIACNRVRTISGWHGIECKDGLFAFKRCENAARFCGITAALGGNIIQHDASTAILDRRIYARRGYRI